MNTQRLLHNKLPPIRIKSFSGSGVDYTVDRSERTCTCLQFAARGHCKHLDEVGVYQPKQFTPRPHPTFSQALSGLVKSIRLRRVEDAIYFLVYLDQFPPNEKLSRKAARFRVARRILIGAAEDGMSLSVMEEVAANFKFLCKLDTPLVYLAAEIVRLTGIPNWWDPSTGGHDYILSSLIGFRQQVLYRTVSDPETAKGLLRRAVVEKDRATAIGAVCLLGAIGIGSTRQAEYLMTIAQEMNHETAIRLLSIHLGTRSALAGDNNYLCLAVWWLAGGQCPVADQIEPVTAAEVYELLDRTRAQWEHPDPIPEWAVDGVHCSGRDRRYCGVLSDMAAVCAAYNKFGNINPENQWDQSFFVLDGLQYEFQGPEDEEV